MSEVVSEFVDRVSAQLTLTIGAKSFVVAPRDVERFALHLHPWGHEGEIEFRITCESDPSEDELFAPFVTPDLAEVALSLGRTFDEPGEETQKLVVRGLAVDRAVEEQAVEGMSGAPIFERRYLVRFVDRAQALWSQHRPAFLLVDATYETLFRENTPGGVTLTHAWAASSVKRPIVAGALGADGSRATFYDLVFWLADRHGAALFVDHATGKYQIADAKPAGGEAIALEPDEVASIEVRLPRLRRDKVVVLNGWSEAGEKKREGTNAEAVAGLRSDHLLRTPIASRLGDRAAVEAKRAAQPKAGAWVELAAFPAAPIAPNMKVEPGEGFSDKLYVHGKTFRVVHAVIEAWAEGEATGPDAELGRAFKLRYGLELEQAADPVKHHRPHAAPLYPFHVEGKVVSETGADDEDTYQIYQDTTTSLDLYKVKVPLFSDRVVVVPFEPMTTNGQLYLPAYRDARVLLALDLLDARFAGYLDWKPGARLPLATQGNHLLFGKKAASQTSVSHVYVDGKPVLTIARTSENDEQTIEVSEGTLLIKVEEKPS